MRKILALLVASLLAASGGVTAAWVVTHSGESPGQPEGAEAQVAPAPDPAVEFPPALANLPGIPSDLLVHPSTGEIWFPLFGIGGPAGARLYRYSPVTGTLKAYDLPPDVGSPLYSGIAADARGHVIVAYGQRVVDFDPLMESNTDIPLPDPPLHSTRNYEVDKAWVTDIAISSNTVFVGRLNAASITQLDLAAGTMNERAIPPSFGPPIDLLMTADGLYLSNWIGFGAPRRVARLNLATNVFAQFPVAASDLALHPDGSLLVATLDAPGISRLTAQGREAVALPLQPELTGVADRIAVDSQRSNLWVAGWQVGRIARFDLATGQSKVYQLPIDVVHAEFSSCPATLPPRPCPTGIGITVTSVGGLAIDLQGSLYFSDQTKNRIGFIRVANQSVAPAP